MPDERIAATPRIPDSRDAHPEQTAVLVDLPAFRDGLAAKDPQYAAISGLWNNKQQRGRAAYDACADHPQISAALGLDATMVQRQEGHFVPNTRNPTPRQREIVEFANFAYRHIDWVKLIAGPYRMKARYGFSLAEATTQRSQFNGRPVTVPHTITPLPQGTLDGTGGEHDYNTIAATDTQYECFTQDSRGNITSVIQNHSRPELRVEWTGPSLKYILHFKNGGGDGNPYGESVLHSVYNAWADLYLFEELEATFLDTAQPVTALTYRTEDGTPRTALHSSIETQMNEKSQTASQNFIVAPDLSGFVLSPSNPDFVAHIKSVKAERRRDAWMALLTPRALITEATDTEADARNLIQVYLKYILPARLAEFAAPVEAFIHDIIRSNYSNTYNDDLPQLRWNIRTENEVRVLQGIFQTIYPDIEEAALGDFVDEFIPGAGEFMARTHAESIGAKRPRSTPETQDSKDNPPEKPEGAVQETSTGNTATPSTTTNTDA